MHQLGQRRRTQLCLGPGRAHHVNGGERDIACVLAHHHCRLPARGLHRSRLSRPDAELAQRLQAPRAHDMLSALVARTENSVDRLPVGGENRSVRKGHIGFLLLNLPVVEQLHVDRPCGLSRREDTRQHGADRVPDLAPALATGLAQRCADAWPCLTRVNRHHYTVRRDWDPTRSR